MPHDLRDSPISVGDRVNVPCIVKAIQTGTDYCNVTLETTEKMFPGDSPSTISLNAKQTERV